MPFHPVDAVSNVNGISVVFITSNYGGNTEMMEGCKMLGIPAFGMFVLLLSSALAYTRLFVIGTLWDF